MKQTQRYNRHSFLAPYAVHLLIVGILAIALAACNNDGAATVSPTATMIAPTDIPATSIPASAVPATAIPTAADALPTASPTPPTPTPEPATWKTVREATWKDTLHVKLDLFGPSIYRGQSGLRARTRVENVSDEPASILQWSEDDPAVPIWIVLPRPPRPAGAPRGALRLIPLREEGYTPRGYGISSFPRVVEVVLEPGDVRELEVVWDLNVPGTGSGERDRAPDGEYTLRADFFPLDGVRNPGLPDISLELPITLMRGIPP